MEKDFPKINLNLGKLRQNIDTIVGLCKSNKIKVAGVIKGCDGEVAVVNEMIKGGVGIIASSRLRHLKSIKFLWNKVDVMLIRTPMLSEVDQVVEHCTISLNSDIKVLEALDNAAQRQGVIHNVILMTDLGDLREGFWNKRELEKISLYIDSELSSLKLVGLGTNLGCYGSVVTTPEKMNELVAIAEQIELTIGRKLDYICGGGTMSLPLLLNNTMPDRVNLLRLGESIILAKDLEGEIKDTYQDVFTLSMEVIEVEDKPTYPVGQIEVDGFGLKNTYVDRGIRRRALLAGGKVDYGYPEMLTPTKRGIEIVGASSDHTIIDIEDAEDIFTGDIIDFKLSYASLVYSMTSEDVTLSIKE